MNQHRGNGYSMSCQNWNKEFGYKNSFDRHVSVCGVKRTTFKCSFCEKSFHLKDTLRNHVHAKHGEHSHICEMCGKHFEWKSSYRRHLKNVHKDDNPDATVNNWMNASTLIFGLCPFVDQVVLSLHYTYHLCKHVGFVVNYFFCQNTNLVFFVVFLANLASLLICFHCACIILF